MREIACQPFHIPVVIRLYQRRLEECHPLFADIFSHIGQCPGGRSAEAPVIKTAIGIVRANGLQHIRGEDRIPCSFKARLHLRVRTQRLVAVERGRQIEKAVFEVMI